jgi:hypothetical protein
MASYQWDCRNEDQNDITHVAIGRHGRMYLLCQGCADVMAAEGDDNGDPVTLYDPQEILSAAALADL